ncbi:MAG: P1 family peptidase [Hylemonella sp.]|uniref:P1 family peptidase n=1 Tax=Hylemonella sp. TaxID=2066020 RepID=UPI0022BE2C02|nr:P1 family peptidase [Hylemonella sp.]MCZ8253152.1 P1 family peptidase [Hylemonella sp.]
MRSPPLPYPGAITDVAGIDVGHDSDTRRPTGCTVVLARQGAVGGVDVRGAAPGTRETDLLAPGNLVQQVHAVLLAGGSAWGLDAAGGVMRWLEQQGIGLNTGHGLVPIVPAAVIFDLGVGDSRIRPDAESGYRACAAASRLAPAQGNVGAGSGALVGKLLGAERAMKGGVGTASVTANDVTVGALIVCNAVGDVLDPATGRVIAGARTADGRALQNTRDALLQGMQTRHALAGRNTTIGVIATDAVLDKAQAQRLAQVAHDGLARSINPVHTQLDGDTLFALGTGTSGRSADMLLLATLAAEATARAVVNAVHAACGLSMGTQYWPACTDWTRP